MIKLTDTKVMNLENAILGARNPLNSWTLSDSHYENNIYIIGANDLRLAQKLCNAGSDHRKFIRQIFISVNITAPLYWWKEYDTYKVGTVANSTSTMHKITAKPFSINDFSHDKMDTKTISFLEQLITTLEENRLLYLKTQNKRFWYNIIQLLPSSYNQLRTCTLNYETCINIYHSRKNHKLEEWHVFCQWITELPYFKQFFSI